MWQKMRLQKRPFWIAAILAGGLCAFAVSWAMAAPAAKFLYLATNLSQSPDYPSYYPDIAVSPDGDRVAVVWSEQCRNGCSNAQQGSVFLRWASESAGVGWSAPITVFEGSNTAVASWVAVAVTGTNPYTAYVAYIVKPPPPSSGAHRIYYRACSLTVGGACGAATEIANKNPGDKDAGYMTVDIALDAAGNPHFVYVYYQWNDSLSRDVGIVYYKGPPNVEEETISGGYNARRPAIAWQNGVVHVVWETVPTTGSDYYIIHTRRTDSGWGGMNTLIKQGSSYAPHNPAIAVFSNTVMVVWDMNYECSDSCTKFTLAYIRSTDNGYSWPIQSGIPVWYELKGDQRGTDHPYTSTSAAAAEYFQYLRPSVGFMGDGKPVVVWHVNRGTQDNPDYDLYYTQALTVPGGAGSAIEWAEIGLFGQNTVGQQTSPRIAPYLPSSVLHTAYVWKGDGTEDWETFYDGNRYEDYPHVFLPIVLRNFSGGG